MRGLQLGFQAGDLVREGALAIVGSGEGGQIGSEVRIINILRQPIPDLEGEGHEGGGLGIGNVQADGSLDGTGAGAALNCLMVAGLVERRGAVLPRSQKGAVTKGRRLALRAGLLEVV